MKSISLEVVSCEDCPYFNEIENILGGYMECSENEKTVHPFEVETYKDGLAMLYNSCPLEEK